MQQNLPDIKIRMKKIRNDDIFCDDIFVKITYSAFTHSRTDLQTEGIVAELIHALFVN